VVSRSPGDGPQGPWTRWRRGGDSSPAGGRDGDPSSRPRVAPPPIQFECRPDPLWTCRPQGPSVQGLTEGSARASQRESIVPPPDGGLSRGHAGPDLQRPDPRMDVRCHRQPPHADDHRCHRGNGPEYAVPLRRRPHGHGQLPETGLGGDGGRPEDDARLQCIRRSDPKDGTRWHGDLRVCYS